MVFSQLLSTYSVYMGAGLMIFVNVTGEIGTILSRGTTTLTGNLTATLLLILIILFVLGIMFTIPIEFAGVILLPFCISVAAFYSEFLGPVVTIIVFLSTILAKNWIFR